MRETLILVGVASKWKSLDFYLNQHHFIESAYLTYWLGSWSDGDFVAPTSTTCLFSLWLPILARSRFQLEPT
jgi:hypothetical protein